MNNNKATNKRPRPAFGQRAAWHSTWDNVYDNAESERIVMLGEFRVWLVKTRIEVERRLLVAERRQKEIAPLAAASMHEVETPQDVGACVIEFAQASIDVLQFKRQLKLLNTFYRQAASNEFDSSFPVEDDNESEFNELWAWFIQERAETQG